MVQTKYSQTQQTFVSPHFPMGTPPIPLQLMIDVHEPSIVDVVGWGDPGISDVTIHVGPEGAKLASITPKLLSDVKNRDDERINSSFNKLFAISLEMIRWDGDLMSDEDRHEDPNISIFSTPFLIMFRILGYHNE